MNYRKILLPGLLGNVIEWYDFALYGFFAIKLAKVFFPENDHLTSMLMTYSVFTIGIFLRPIGGILFGRIGDKYGRKKALLYSLFLTAISTFFIGIIPSYEQIGIYSTILLILCRFMQGIAVGGEFTCSIVYILEHVKEEKKGFYGSLIMASAFLGILLGSATTFLINFLIFYLNKEELWRLPFIFGIVLAFWGYYFRKSMEETPIFKLTLSLQSKYSLKQIDIKRVIIGTSFVIVPSAIFYLVFIYLIGYMEKNLLINPVYISFMNFMNMMLMIVSAVLMGYLSDYIGKKKVLNISLVGLFILAMPSMLLIKDASLLQATLIHSVLSILVGISYSTIPALLFELFNIHSRCSSISISYNLANALFGGFAPLISTMLVYNYGIISLGYYIISLILISLSLSLLFNNSQRIT